MWKGKKGKGYFVYLYFFSLYLVNQYLVYCSAPNKVDTQKKKCVNIKSNRIFDYLFISS